MESFGYLLSVAFSGSDLTRAIWFALIGILITSKYLPPLKTTLLLVLIDRIWPFVSMGVAGHDVNAVSAAVAHAISTLPIDLPVILLRGAVLYGIVTLGYQARLRLHGKKATLATGKRT